MVASPDANMIISISTAKHFNLADFSAVFNFIHFILVPPAVSRIRIAKCHKTRKIISFTIFFVNKAENRIAIARMSPDLAKAAESSYNNIWVRKNVTSTADREDWRSKRDMRSGDSAPRTFVFPEQAEAFNVKGRMTDGTKEPFRRFLDSENPEQI